MRKAGGIIGIIAGVFAVCFAMFTLFCGIMAIALGSSQTASILWAFAVGILVGGGQIILGAMAIHSSANEKVLGMKVGTRLCWASVAGILAGNAFSIIFSILGLVAGIMIRQGEKEIERQEVPEVSNENMWRVPALEK